MKLDKKMDIYKTASEKLKELKIWAQVKSPKKLQPILSYALDWLSPELLGTGFRMLELSEGQMKAVIPAFKTNLDWQKEIHLGLVTNAANEMVRAFLQKQMPESFFKITAVDFQIIKKQKWTQEIQLIMNWEQNSLDDFFIQLQLKKKSEITFEIKVTSENQKKQDILNVHIWVEAVSLIN